MNTVTHAASAPPLTLLKKDFDLLSKFANVNPGTPVTRFLDEELARADVVTHTKKKTVRLGSRVLYHDLSKAAPSWITLVPPHEAVITQHRVSVLTPVGAALIGMEEGQRITFAMPWTGERTLAVLKVEQGGAEEPVTA